MKYVSFYNSPFSKIILQSDGENITSLFFEGQKYAQSTSDNVVSALPVFDLVKKWLDVYFSGKDPGFFVPIKLEGSSFRKKVWKQLLAIPYGKTITYGEIASAIASESGISRMSAQAVGGAVGHNPIAIIVPCHRVIGRNGSLTGYAGGLDIKEKLLKCEGIL